MVYNLDKVTIFVVQMIEYLLIETCQSGIKNKDMRADTQWNTQGHGRGKT